MTKPKATRTIQISTDQWLGAFGCSLAIAAASFGLYMNIRGPAGPATGHDFTIFAQLAPRPSQVSARPAKVGDDLDTAATASIAAAGDEAPPGPDGVKASGRVLRGIVVRAADPDMAEIAVDGRTTRVRVGDTIPGAGQVLSILPGRRPMLETSLGVIVSDH